jgi:DNA-binding LacI/PurR family transcriptional regulator
MATGVSKMMRTRGITRNRPTKETFLCRCNDLYSDLIGRIKNGAPGALLPSEDALASEFHLSRISVRKVIAQLEWQGLLSKVNGKGSVIGKITETRADLSKTCCLLIVPDNARPATPLSQTCRLAERATYILSVMESELSRHGLTIRTVPQSEIPAGDPNMIKSLRGEGFNCAAGIYTSPAFDEWLRLAANNGLAVLAVKIHGHGSPGFNTVCYDNYMVGRIAAEHLAESGHKKIACVHSNLNLEWETERALAFSDICKTAGQDGSFRIFGADGEGDINEAPELYWESVGARAAEKILKEDGLTGVFCVNDSAAKGMMERLAALGVRVPDDISIIGCDNDHTYFQHGLTTVSLEFHKAGFLAADAIAKKIRGEEFPVWPALIKVPPLLIRRRTVRRLERQT